MLRKPVPRRVSRPTSRPNPVEPEKKPPAAPTVPLTPARDTLGHTAVLDHRAVYPLLGVPVEIRSNNPAVLAAAERSYGRWRELGPEHVVLSAPLTVDVIVHPGRSWEVRPTSLVCRSHGDWLLGGTESNLLTARLDLGQAVAFVTPEVVNADLFFRRNILEYLALHLIERHDRTPLAAAAVVRNGRPLVLIGPSGCGKSILCYACLKADFQLLADEVVHVSLRNGLRLWGVPWQLHMPADAPRWLPELADLPTEQQPGGKLRIVLDVNRFGAERACPFAENPIVILLNRERRTSSALELLDRTAVQEVLAENDAALVNNLILMTGGAYRLHLGSDLAGAVKRLQELTTA